MDLREPCEQIGHLILGDVVSDADPIDLNDECHYHRSLQGHSLYIDPLAAIDHIHGRCLISGVAVLVEVSDRKAVYALSI